MPRIYSQDFYEFSIHSAPRSVSKWRDSKTCNARKKNENENENLINHRYWGL